MCQIGGIEPPGVRALEPCCARCQQTRAITDCLLEGLEQSVSDHACVLDLVHGAGRAPHASQVIVVLEFSASRLVGGGLSPEGGVVDDFGWILDLPMSDAG